MIGDPTVLVPGYAAAGVAVLPLHAAPNGVCTCGNPTCASPGKHPRLKHGAKDATTDVTTIAEWMGRWPSANWGGCPPAGVVVLDVDPRNGGDATLNALQKRHNPLPSTLTARTGSGGWHYWFTYAGPSRGKIGEGLDVKRAGGYLCMPPSVHACGGEYIWTNQAPAVPAPRWLRLLLAPPRPMHTLHPVTRASGIGGLVKFVMSAPEGQRNSSLYWAACRSHEAGHDPSALVDAAEAIGLTRMEAEATVRSAEHAPTRGAQ